MGGAGVRGCSGGAGNGGGDAADGVAIDQAARTKGADHRIDAAINAAGAARRHRDRTRVDGPIDIAASVQRIGVIAQRNAAEVVFRIAAGGRGIAQGRAPAHAAARTGVADDIAAARGRVEGIA